MRKVIIGDIHGCIAEFKLLLEKVGFEKGVDKLYQVGDLINKGPNSKACFELLMELEGTAVLGNHEYHLIRDANGIDVNKKWIAGFKAHWGDSFESYLETIKKWPFFYRDDDFLMVHGGLIPEIRPEDSDPFLLTNIRTWDGKGENLKSESNPAWFELYKKKEKVIFGHWAALGGVNRENAIGLDTGCVYGKKLTALVLPKWELISVDAKEPYCPIQ